jgi:multiple sugar transport system substrate-binding protein
MFRKIVYVLFVSVVLLAACQTREEETPTPTLAPDTPVPVDDEESVSAPEVEEVEPAVVRFAVFDFELGRYDDLIEAFEEENEDIKIKTVSVEEILELESLGAEWPDDAARRLVSAADVSSVFHSNEAVQEGLLLDLAPFVEADPNFDPDDFYQNVLERYQSGGGTWAVPTEVNFQVILFNKDIFDEADADYPQAGWSWEDFLATSQKLTIHEGDEVAQWGYVEIVPNPAFILQGQAGPLFDMESDPPTPLFDDPEVVDAMRWYSDLFTTHEVTPFFPSPDEEAGGLNIPEGFAVIEGQQAAMWSDVTAAWPFRSQQWNLGVAPFPVEAPDSASTPLLTSGLSISVGTAEPEAAWRWADFLSRQTSELGFGLGTPTSLPARRSAAEASSFWDDIDQELATALRFALDHSFAPSYPPGGTGVLGDALAAVVDEGKSVEEALADAQLQAEEGIGDELAQAGEEDEAITVDQEEAESAASEDAITVEFIAGANPFEMQSFRQLSEAFLEENPDVVVEIKAPDFFEGAPSFGDIAGASDCFFWFPGSFNDPETTAAILSIDPFLDADPGVNKDDFYPMVYEAFTAQGQTWGLPAQVNVTLIEYNKDLFDSAGEAYPTADWTTEEFLSKAAALTQGEEEAKQYGYMSDLFEPTDMLSFVDRLGITLLDESVDPPAMAFNDPAVVEAVRWYTGLTTDHDVKPVLMTSLTDVAVSAIQERENLLAEGRAAMWTNSAIGVPLGAEEERDYATGAVPLPAGPSGIQGSGFQSASGYFVSADTEAREACWRWITYLSEQPNIGSGLPARTAVAESEAYRQHVGSELSQAYLTSVESANQPPFSLQISDENSWLGYPVLWLYEAYSDVISGEVGVEEALDNAQHLADEYRACVVAADAQSDEDGQKACMMEIDDSLPEYLFAGGG